MVCKPLSYIFLVSEMLGLKTKDLFLSKLDFESVTCESSKSLTYFYNILI
jgi:hypothetical protein